MKNAIKISITILEKELQVVDSDFTDQYKKEFVRALEAKYGGKIELIETRVLLPILTKDGD